MVDSQISQPQQETPEMLLDLDAFLVPPATVLLKEQSSSHLSLEIWQANERNPAMCDLGLIGDSQQLENTVRVETPRLLADSNWARIRHQQQELKTTGSQVVPPVRTSHAAVYKLVQALYSSSVQLTEDVEAVLLLANSIQVTYLPPNSVAQQQILNSVSRPSTWIRCTSHEPQFESVLACLCSSNA